MIRLCSSSEQSVAHPAADDAPSNGDKGIASSPFTRQLNQEAAVKTSTCDVRVKSVVRSQLCQAQGARHRNSVGTRQQTKSDWFWRGRVLCNTMIFQSLNAGSYDKYGKLSLHL